jgi:hypothetical protein
MEKAAFEKHLIQASQFVVEFTRPMVIQTLPDPVLYRVFPNQSFDANPRVEDEQTFPEETLPDDRYHGDWTSAQVLQFLWRNSKVPEWINVQVKAVDASSTYLGLYCCGRFTGSEKLLYHAREGYPPFHVLSPPLPQDWHGKAQGRKFDLYWFDKKHKH